MRGACHLYIVVLVIASRYQDYNVDLAAVANAIRGHHALSSLSLSLQEMPYWDLITPLCCLGLHLQGKTKFVARLVELGAIQVGGQGHFDAIPKLLFVRKANL